jgi:DNA-directed RNA polymerase subunit H (RpoH/RPB5)
MAGRGELYARAPTRSIKLGIIGKKDYNTMSKQDVIRALATVKEMLIDRGLELGDLEGVGDDEVHALVTALDVFSMRSASKDVIFILKKLKNSELVKAAEILADDRRDSALIISKDKMSGVNLKCVQENFGKGAECFTVDELAVNISKHVLVPEHSILPAAEGRALLERLMLRSMAQMPAIYRTDPMARYIGARVGDVVQIRRASPTAGEALFFRVCV